MKNFDPFNNESELLRFQSAGDEDGNEFCIENRLDQVSLYGSLDLKLDHDGLENIQMLIKVLGKIEAKISEHCEQESDFKEKRPLLKKPLRMNSPL
jgi:hypothetical protein